MREEFQQSFQDGTYWLGLRNKEIIMKGFKESSAWKMINLLLMKERA